MMPENIEKNMYLRRRLGKITLLSCLKKEIIYNFLVKPHYNDARKY